MKPKIDKHRQTMEFLIQRINEINEWRQEAILQMPHRAKEIEARVLELREAAERGH